jgi:hypothetical protein
MIMTMQTLRDSSVKYYVSDSRDTDCTLVTLPRKLPLPHYCCWHSSTLQQ